MSQSEPAKGMPTEFRIVAENHLIEDFRSTQPLRGALFGTIADHPAHGRLLRWAIRGVAGPAFGFKRLDANDPSKPAEDLKTPIDECAAITSEIARLNGSPATQLTKLTPTARELDFARFAAEHPFVAEALGLTRQRAAGLFDPGPAWYPVKAHPNARVVEWRELLDRHVAGDHGILGTHDPDVPMGAADLWADGLDDRRTRMSRAVLLGAGLVMSAYGLHDATRPGLVAWIRTALIPGRPETLMIVRPGEHLPVE